MPRQIDDREGELVYKTVADFQRAYDRNTLPIRYYNKSVYNAKIRELRDIEKGGPSMKKVDVKKRILKGRSDRAKEEKAAKKKRAAEILSLDNPPPDPPKQSLLNTPVVHGDKTAYMAFWEYVPWQRPYKEGSPLTIFDNPPQMSERCREVFDDLSKRIPDPAALGMTPEKITYLVRYCYLQAFLLARKLDVMNDIILSETRSGGTKEATNPEFTNWLNVSKHLNFIHKIIFSNALVENVTVPSKQKQEGDSEEEEGGNDYIVTAKDFPAAIRQSAVEAAEITKGEDLSELLPFGMRIGDKIKRTG